MPKNASLDQRIEWHLEHLKHCNCRSSIPAKLAEAMRKKGLPVPEGKDLYLGEPKRVGEEEA